MEWQGLDQFVEPGSSPRFFANETERLALTAFLAFCLGALFAVGCMNIVQHGPEPEQHHAVYGRFGSLK